MVLISEYFRYRCCGTCHSAGIGEKLLGFLIFENPVQKFPPNVGSWVDLRSKGAGEVPSFLPTPTAELSASCWFHLHLQLSSVQQLLAPAERLGDFSCILPPSVILFWDHFALSGYISTGNW